MALSLRILGTLEAEVDGVPVDLGGPRQRSVLALLLVGRGEVVSVDRLIDDLWHGEPPPRAMGALQAYISNLRRVLEPDRAPRTPSQYLVSAAPGYAVRVPDEVIDARRFEQLLREGTDAGTAAGAVTVLDRALALWRGGALAEFAHDPWAAPEAARLDELRLLARERLAEARVRAGRPHEAIVEAEALVRELPLREEGWRLLALAQYLAGRQGDALATLRRARRTLSDELGIDPGPRLAELERAVLDQDVRAFAEPEREPEPQPVRSAGEPGAGADAPGAAASSATEPVPASASVAPASADGAVRSARAPFVGRTPELAALRGAAAAARPEEPAIVLVAGEAGAGKSALLGRLRDELGAEGWRIAIGRCPEADGGPPARAWSDVVRGLAVEHDPGRFAAPLAPLLLDEFADRPDTAGLMHRFQLHRAVHDWISTLTDRPLVVFLDDVHRADAETRTLLAALLDDRLASRVLFVLAYRPETDDGLADLLATTARHSPTRIRLSGLDEDEVAELVETVTGEPPDIAVVRALATRTDGNPFYLKESARLLVSEGELVATSQVPEGVADVLRRRLARLPAESVSVLRLASVIGRDVDVSLLVRAAEVDEDAVLDALETGLVSGLLGEPAVGAVRFSHLLVRETLYSGVSQLRRMRWHARVAQAVAELFPSDLAARAHHSARSATAATAREAAQHCVAAAEAARRRFAYDIEAELYLEAQRCLSLLPEPDAAASVEVLAQRVRALIWSGGTTTARGVRAEAVAIAVGTDDTDLIARAVSCGTTPSLRGTMRRYAEVDEGFLAVLEQLLQRPLAPATRSLVLSTFVRETSSMEDPRCAKAYTEALALAREVGDPALVGMALGAGIEEFPADTAPEQHVEVLAQLVELGEQHPELPMYAIGGHLLACNRSSVRLELQESHRHIEAVRSLARQYQLPQGIFLADVSIAMLTHIEGDADRADEQYQAAYRTQLTRGTVDADAATLLATLTVRYTQQRLDELVPMLDRAYSAGYRALGHLYALALAESGDLDRAREVAAEAPELLYDYLFLVLGTVRALTLGAVGGLPGAQALYERLLPFADQVAGASTVAFAIGPVAQGLGRLAVSLGHPADARIHFEQARDVARRCGSAVWERFAEQALAELHENAGA